MGIQEPSPKKIKSIKVEYILGEDVHFQGFVNPKEVVINPDYIYIVDSDGDEIQFTRRHVLRTVKTFT